MISVSASFEWNDKTKIMLQQAPEKIVKQIARQTLDFTRSEHVVANSKNAPYKIPRGHSSGLLERSTINGGVKGDYQTGFYIGSFTDYASYVYEREGVHWTNPNTKTKWFEYIWDKYGKGVLENACKVNKL